MLYQLPNGKVVEMSLEDYLEMSDADFQNLLGYNIGEHTNNPWLNSAIDEDQEPEEEEEALLKELDNVSDIDKLLEQDFTEEE